MLDPKLPFAEVRDLASDVRQLFAEIAQAHAAGGSGVLGECSPEVDVFEAAGDFHVLVSLPGVAASSIRILIKQTTLVIAGEKLPAEPSRDEQGSFHLIERTFGRFARAVRMTGAIDAARTRASLTGGELKIVVPKITERRGQTIRVPIEPARE